MVSYITGWWYTYPSEKYDFVSWDDEILNIGKINNVPNNQPGWFYTADMFFSLRGFKSPGFHR